MTNAAESIISVTVRKKAMSPSKEAQGMKSYKISEDLFLDLVKYHLLDMQDPERAERIRAGLAAKMKSDARRRDYAETLAKNRAHYDFTGKWAPLYDQWQQGKISSEDFRKAIGVKPAAFLNLITEYRRLTNH